MEPTQLKGKNEVDDFDNKISQEKDARMDALAVTPVCLRVALTIYNNLSFHLKSSEINIYYSNNLGYIGNL